MAMFDMDHAINILARNGVREDIVDGQENREGWVLEASSGSVFEVYNDETTRQVA